MPAAFTTLEISTGGVTIVNLVDMVNYQLQNSGWSPRVTQRRHLLEESYEDVIEEITVNVTGATGADALANLAVLARLLDQAEEWAEGFDTVPAVILECLPQGSNLANPLQATIVGSDESNSLTNLPLTFNDELVIYEITGVKIRFRRIGLWLGDESSNTAASEQVTQVMSVNLGSSEPLYSPSDISLSNSNMPDQSPRGFLVAFDSEDDVLVVRGRDRLGSISTGYLTGATSNLYPRTTSGSMWTSGNITTTSNWGYSLSAAPLKEATLFNVILSVHITSGNGVNAYYLYHTLGAGSLPNSLSESSKVEITPDNAGNPEFVSLGLLAVPEGIVYPSPYFQIVFDVLDGATTLIIDVVAIVRMDKGSSQIVQLRESPIDGSGGANFLDIKHNLLSKLKPTYYARNGASTQKYVCSSSGSLLTKSKGSNPGAVLLATANDYWRFGNATAVSSSALTIARRPAYLVPQ